MAPDSRPRWKVSSTCSTPVRCARNSEPECAPQERCGGENCRPEIVARRRGRFRALLLVLKPEFRNPPRHGCAIAFIFHAELFLQSRLLIQANEQGDDHQYASQVDRDVPGGDHSCW